MILESVEVTVEYAGTSRDGWNAAEHNSLLRIIRLRNDVLNGIDCEIELHSAVREYNRLWGIKR